MKTLSIVLALLPLALSSDLPVPVLKGDWPIYLGDSFLPPTMTFFAWIPTADKDPKEWCTLAADASDDTEFSLHGMDGLKVHDYFTKEAYITWMGARFMDCIITPEAVKLPLCDGFSVLNTDGSGKRRYLGPGHRKWTCWVVSGEGSRAEDGGRNSSSQEVLDEMVARGSEEKLTDGTTKPTGAALSSSIMGAFTAVVTAM